MIRNTWILAVAAGIILILLAGCGPKSRKVPQDDIIISPFQGVSLH